MALEIDVELKNYRCFADGDPARVTIRPGFTALIGKNNCGKSTLLRLFYDCRNMFAKLADHSMLLGAIDKWQPFDLPTPWLGTAEPLFHDGNDRNIVIGLRPRDPDWTSGDIAPLLIELELLRDRNLFRVRLFTRAGNAITSARSKSTNANGILKVNDVIVGRADTLSHVFTTLADTFYIGSFRNAINIGSNETFYDVPVGQAFIKFWKHMQAGSSKKQGEATHLLKHDIRKIFEFDELDIVPSENEQTLYLMINGKQYSLLDVGSGIAHFIMVLATAHNRRPSFILIDEPELSLHASLQADFLQTLAAQASMGVVFATHNLGLARTVADRIYSVTRDGGQSFVQPYERTPSLAEFTGALSFGDRPELGFNRVLLTESPADGRVVQQFLRQLGKEHEILAIPLGGSTLINDKEGTVAQLSELRRITDRISALIDSELQGPGATLDNNRVGFLDACRRLNIPCHVLERRAIENYFTAEAIERGIGPGRKALDPFEKLGEKSPGWPKAQGWRVAREMTLADLKDTDLGSFLADL